MQVNILLLKLVLKLNKVEMMIAQIQVLDEMQNVESVTGIVAWRKLLTQRHGWKFITSMFEEKIISLSIRGADQ